MEPPGSNAPDGIRDEKVKVLRAIEPLNPEHLIRGQYRGYLDEKGVDPNSKVETYAAVRLKIDSWRWSGVPILIRVGKSLKTTATEVMVRFRPAPQRFFANQEIDCSSNYIRIRFNPEEIIALGAVVRKEGEKTELKPVELTAVRQALDEVPPYARLLQYAMQGDPTLFSREDLVESAWRIVDPILDQDTPLYPYDPGTWGPKEADDLIQSCHGWHNP
jgi:glucose-6-phosphate 1-dehydrogenase